MKKLLSVMLAALMLLSEAAAYYKNKGLTLWDNMKELYKKRVDNFYMFNDKNNCKRVYEAIRKL